MVGGWIEATGGQNASGGRLRSQSPVVSGCPLKAVGALEVPACSRGSSDLSHGQADPWLDWVLDFSCSYGKWSGRGLARTGHSTEC